MRVRVSYVVEVDDVFRKSLMEFYGKSGLASWEDIERHMFLYGMTVNEQIKGTFSIREDVSGAYVSKKKTRRLPKVV